MALSFFTHPGLADPVFEDPRLDTFINDLTDESNTRHYNLVSKQAAIHKWLTRECMQDLGFEDEASADPAKWQQALHGKYLYCLDHHIPGIDPPCPSEDVVENSVNNACYQRAHDQIDWSYNIMHTARGDLADWSNIDDSDLILQAIEAEWSNCMAKDGFHYESRFEMFSSSEERMINSADADTAEISENKLMQSAESCFDTTDYYQKRHEHIDRLRVTQFRNRKAIIETMLTRYEVAEQLADETIEKYCGQDRSVIVSMYEQDKYTDNTICE